MFSPSRPLGDDGVRPLGDDGVVERPSALPLGLSAAIPRDDIPVDLKGLPLGEPLLVVGEYHRSAGKVRTWAALLKGGVAYGDNPGS